MRCARVLLLLAAFAVLAGGCGGAKESADTTSTVVPPATTTSPAPTTTAAGRPISLELFYLAPDGQLVASTRTIENTRAPGAATLHELMNPPEGTDTQVPNDLHLTIDNGRAHVTGASLNDAALAQIVYSLTSFPTVRSVNGKTRQDVEGLGFAPPILVEDPTPGESVRSPIRVTGTADTYEATFNYSLRDAAGKQLAHDYVTATSGNGERGTFAFDVPFSVGTAQNGTLKVFEYSAENGAVIHEREIPLRLLP